MTSNFKSNFVGTSEDKRELQLKLPPVLVFVIIPNHTTDGFEKRKDMQTKTYPKTLPLFSEGKRKLQLKLLPKLAFVRSLIHTAKGFKNRKDKQTKTYPKTLTLFSEGKRRST